MCNPRRGIPAAVIVIVLLSGAATAVAGLDLKETRAMIDGGRIQDAIQRLVREIEENPAHEAARIQLADAYEKAGLKDDAIATWEDLMRLSKNEDHLRQGRRAISRILRQQIDAGKAERPPDPFLIPMPPIEWEGLERIEDNKYLPPILPPPMNFDVPPFVHETQHFTVYSANERLSKVVAERSEIYLQFMLERLFAGRAWAVRVPILVYTTVEDYQRHGGPVGTAGVAFAHVTGKTQAIILFQLKPDFSSGRRGGRRGGGGGAEVWRYGIESVLPHELTHAIINEFFAGQRPPQWLHEAIAGRFEQTRDHYSEAARLARKVMAGEYFRMRDLFDQQGYPERIELFYEQAAIVVLYLFETGPEAMHAFLSELKATNNDHDAACAAALGIPKENAVEEFERRWVLWMRDRYFQDLRNEVDDTITSSVAASKHAAFRPRINEPDTVASLTDWRVKKLDSLGQFLGVGRSLEHWSVADGTLRCNIKPGDEASLLGIRMNETAPVVVSCKVRYLGNPADPRRHFGFAQLNAEGFDTPVRALAVLPDTQQHEVYAIWGDDLAVYLNGECVGRFPAFAVGGGNAPDVDHPLALVSNGPVEIQDLKIGKISSFSTKPVVVTAEASDSEDDRQRSQQERRGRRRSRGP